MAHSTLIVCEQSGRWAAALRRFGELAPRETRTLEDCAGELAATPRALVALETQPHNAEAVWKFLAQMERLFPESQAAILLDRRLLDLGPGLRELGAVCVISSILQISDLMAVARRYRVESDDQPADALAAIPLELPWSS